MIIEAIREHIRDPRRVTESAYGTTRQIRPSKPATVEMVALAEVALGLSLPPLLTRLYLEIGNGGFGPGYGLVGTPGGATDDTGRDLVSLYRMYSTPDPDDSLWHWPAPLLPLAHLGCAMYACADTQTTGNPIVWFEPNPHEDGKAWDDSFIPLVDSMHAWLTAWLEGEDLFEPAWERKFGKSA